MSDREVRLRATSWYMPDTVLHRLNGSYVVAIDGFPKIPWLSPDEADAFAASLTDAAALARRGRETGDEE
jgi:predicted regulator of Ras-like GTPase activity (Roadblock/LC7/MglB family)